MTPERYEVVDHMYLVLKNQGMDDDGFESVQFNLPAMPSMLVRVSRFNEIYYREHLLELIENALDCLDVMKRRPEEEEWICDDCTERLDTDARIEAKNQELHDDALLEAEIAEAEGRTAWWRAIARRAEAKTVKADAAAKAAVRCEKEAAAHSKVRIAQSQARMQQPQKATCSHYADTYPKNDASPTPPRRSSRLCGCNPIVNNHYDC